MATKSEILSAVDQVKEHLALNKPQDAIKLMAQVSVAVIENLTDEALIVSKGYEEDLKSLVAAGVINDSTSHNLETLIVSGVQANNGVDVPRDYVDKAYEVLCDEIDIIYKKPGKEETIMPAEQAAAPQEEVKDGPMYDELNMHDEEEPVFLTPDGSVDFREKERHRKRSLAKSLLQDKRKISKLIAIIIPILLIIIVAIVIRGCVASAASDAGYNEAPTILDTIEETTETTKETTRAPYWTGPFTVTGDRVWIRDQANTSPASRKLEYRDKGDQVNVVGEYDDNWAIVSYNGKEGFMSKQYLSKIEEETTERQIETEEETLDAVTEEENEQ